MTRTNAELENLFRRLGSDIGLDFAGAAGAYDDADVATTATTVGVLDVNDITVVTRADAARQLLVNRIQTRRGELAQLGHPTYGSRHHELIGSPNTERTRNLLKLHILECLRHEPRVAKVVRCEIVSLSRHRETVRIELDILLIDEPDPLNLVVPFELDGAP